MGGSDERELKVLLAEGVPLPDVALAVPGAALEELAPQHLEARYLDTPDRALLALGCTLRRRTGEGPVRWTLKVPAADTDTDAAAVESALRRVEHEVVDEAQDPPAELATRAAAVVGPGPLVEVAHLTSDRRRWRLVRDGVVLGELVDDVVVGRVPSGAEVRFREVELEVTPEVTGEELAAVRAQLLAAGGQPGPARSKLERVLVEAGEERR